MNSLHVAWQQPDTREWIPVATLKNDGLLYRLNFLEGARRAEGFSGFGRMNDFSLVYESPDLFPFFSNRLISKSRPEYKDYLRWMGMDEVSGNALDVLSLTRGIRATDSIELIPDLKLKGEYFELDFFPRSLNHVPKNVLGVIAELSVGDPLFLMHDLQNDFDTHALSLRTKSPATLIGYFVKYYAKSLLNKLKNDPSSVSITVKRINPDAPLHMRILCNLILKDHSKFSLTDGEKDFQSIN